MNRIIAAQRSLDSFRDPRYLEIGVCVGESFIPIRAKLKWGVDPCYFLTWKRRLKYAVFSFLGLKVEKLFRMTSDAFFETKKQMLVKEGIDVCFVDGLHTYAQSLRDILNALKYLKQGGVILVHDCNPPSAVVAMPAENIDAIGKQNIPGWTGEWSGDVWKAMVNLRSLHRDLNVFVLDCDTGLGVVTRGAPETSLSYSEAQIDAMDYEFLAANRRELLNLKPQEYFEEFLRKHLRK